MFLKVPGIVTHVQLVAAGKLQGHEAEGDISEGVTDQHHVSVHRGVFIAPLV